MLTFAFCAYAKPKSVPGLLFLNVNSDGMCESSLFCIMMVKVVGKLFTCVGRGQGFLSEGVSTGDGLIC